MTYHYHYEEKEGYCSIVKAPFSIEFGVIKLTKPNRSFKNKLEEEEGSLIILSGECTIETEGYFFPKVGQRDSVFAGKATAVYLPPYNSYEIKS